jgi:phosphate transport system substrate-binding protein
VTSRIGLVSLALSAALACGAIADALKVDESITPYKSVPGVSGVLKSVGSDTMNNEMTLWAEGFRKFYPNVKIEIEGKGSSTAPPALTEGTAHFGPMSREMKAEEVDQFEKTHGYKPTPVRTSVDKDNPIKCLSLPQVDAIFSKTRRGGHASGIATWGEAGLTGPWASQPISLYGRNSASGTYGYIKEHALYKGDYKDSVKEQPGSSSVVQRVASDKYGIGYSGVGYKTADVKAVPLTVKEGGECVDAESAHAYAGTYPLSRFLLVYVNQKPSTPLDPLRLEFIKYVLSRDGQEAVIKDGYLPLTAQMLGSEKARLGIR